MNSAGKFHIKALFDRFQKIHHQVMGNVETAESEDVFVIRPFTLHQAGIESFLSEKAFLDRHKDWRFAGNADVTNPDLIGIGGCGTLFPVTTRDEQAEPDHPPDFGANHSRY